MLGDQLIYSALVVCSFSNTVQLAYTRDACQCHEVLENFKYWSQYYPKPNRPNFSQVCTPDSFAGIGTLYFGPRFEDKLLQGPIAACTFQSR